MPVKIYPNPTTESLYVELSEPLNNGVMTIWDVHGRLVRQENYTQNLIDVSALSSGTYWLQLTSDDVNQTIQFIKN
ncbi:MAG: T9SS type A sorting domain-containing protein [Saprospiraceae bacterium]